MSKRKLNVFIASSSAYVKMDDDENIDKSATRKGKLKHLLDCIENDKHNIKPWWDEAYATGTILQNLLKSINYYDCGIFILGEEFIVTDDKINSISHIPNSNVLLEAGMFYALKGCENTIIIKDEKGKNHISVPSDISGTSILKLSDTTNLTIALNKSFTEIAKNLYNGSDNKTVFFRGPIFTNEILNRNYRKWESKGLYINTESALIWSEIEGNGEDPDINPDIQRINKFLHTIINEDKINAKNINNVISLGSGNGSTDASLICTLREYHNQICYIPVDINPIMAFQALEKVKAHTPFAIIDDFEGNCKHIESIIYEKTHKLGQNNLFIMAGLTFSNLEVRDDVFFNNMRDIMGENDYFLFSVSLVYKNDSENNDKKYQEDARLISSLKNTFTSDNPYKELLINSIIKKYYNVKKDNSFVKGLRNNFCQHIEITETNNPDKYSILSSTNTIECKYIKEPNIYKQSLSSQNLTVSNKLVDKTNKQSKSQKAENVLLLISKRYHEKDIIDYLETTFKVESQPHYEKGRRSKMFILVSKK